MSNLGRHLLGTQQEPVLRLARTYDFPADALWDALTDATRLSRWFGTFQGAAPTKVGDAFQVDLGGGSDDLARGIVTACKPQQRITYDWQWQDETPSRVTITLRSRGERARLELEHALGERDHIVGYGGGWERLLLALQDELSGAPSSAQEHQDAETAGNDAWRALADGG